MYYKNQLIFQSNPSWKLVAAVYVLDGIMDNITAQVALLLKWLILGGYLCRRRLFQPV